MANTAYAGNETPTLIQGVAVRVGRSIKRAFASMIEAREREARRRVNAYPPMIRDRNISC